MTGKFPHISKSQTRLSGMVKFSGAVTHSAEFNHPLIRSFKVQSLPYQGGNYSLGGKSLKLSFLLHFNMLQGRLGEGLPECLMLKG
jgi:hypothetical protein